MEAIHLWDNNIWSFVVSMALLFGAMMLANVLRRTIPFLRKSLIPSSVIGGFLVLAAGGIYKLITGDRLFDAATLEALTYHGLGLGIVAMTFQSSEKLKGKEARRDIFNTGLITVSTYLLQAVAGLVITILLFYLIGSWPQSGILLPMGFGQGPGQAYNWGNTYMNNNGFENGSSFGLSVAALGFLAASIGGVIYMNIAARKGLHRDENAEEKEDLTAAVITTRGEIPLSESLDKLTVQFALVFLAYGLAYGLMYALTLLLDHLGGFFVNTVKPLIWGFNFLFGMLVATIIKFFMRRSKKHGIMHREYTNNFMLTRISGLMFDIMVVASIAAIDLSAFLHREFILPLILISVTGALITYFYIRFLSNKLFPSYRHAEFLVMYGMLTGTASTGLILLREIDPLYETPAANNMIYQNLYAIIFGAPMLLLMGVVAKNMTMTYVTLGALVLLLAIMLVLLFRSRIFKKKGDR